MNSIPCIVVAMLCFVQPISPTTGVIRDVVTPNVEIQHLIREAIRASHENSKADKTVLLIEQLRRQAVLDPREFIVQALLYADDPQNGEDRIIALACIDRFHLNPSDKIQAAIPLLDDERTRNHAEVQRLLRGIEGDRLDARPDFSYYRSLLQGLKDKFPQSLSEHMFRRSAGGALLTYLRNDIRAREELKKVLWAEHVVDAYAWKLQNGFLEKGAKDPDVTAELQLLAERDEWWARRYVVEILHLYPQLDDGQIMESLRSDANAQVSKAASETRAVAK